MEAKSIFWRTGAASGTYVIATKPSGAVSSRRMMYEGTVGRMSGDRRARSSRKDGELLETVSFGTSVSP